MPDATTIFAVLWQASWQAGVLALIVLALRCTLRDRLPAAWRCRLWGLVFLRLLLPAVPASPLSLFNMLPAEPQQARAFVDRPTPAVVVIPRSRGADAVLVTWLATAAGLLSATVLAHVAFARRVRGSRLTAPAEVDEHWRFAAGERGAPRLVVTDAVSSPALFGLVRGRLLLPPNLWDRLSASELRLVFQHELAHVRRWDLLAGWATVVIRCVYWFHPLVWIAERARRADAEAACDDAVLAATDDRLAYGRTLLAVADGRRCAPGVGMADGRTDLRRRLARIATGRRPGRASGVAAAGLTALVGCATLTTRPQAADVDEPTSAPLRARAGREFEDLRQSRALLAAEMNRKHLDGGEPYVASVDPEGRLFLATNGPTITIAPYANPLDRRLAGVPTPDGRGVATKIPTNWDKDATRLILSPEGTTIVARAVEATPHPQAVPAPTTRPSAR